jgi:adenine-specific DNA-methyltransferase
MPTLDWIGKDAVRGHHQEVPFRLLEEQEEMQVGDPEAGNLLVQGDNLHALKALLPYYAGEVECVYIDPPYNTGKEDWVYNDNVNSPEIREWLGKTVGKEAEDLSRHDKWLCMMYPRVALLHELLSEEGSFWMNIDDNEVHHARAMLDEVFGRDHFLASITWEKNYSPRMDSSGFSKAHDYILCYEKSKKFEVKEIPFDQNDEQFNKVDPKTGKRYRARSLQKKGKNARREDRPNLYYAIEAPDGSEVYPTLDNGNGGTWRWEREKYESKKHENVLEWVNDEGEWKVYVKQFYDPDSHKPPDTVWGYDEVGHNHEATEEMKDVLGEVSFSSPKPTRLIQRILDIATEPDDLVLDSFAGSGTTGHATLKQNTKDDGDRRFILVEMKEEVAQDVAFKRLRRVVEGYSYEGKDEDTLMEKKLSVRTLKQGDRIYAESEQIKEDHADQYDKIRREVDDGMFRLYGQDDIEEQKEGLGSGFRYCTLGSPLVNSDGIVRDDVEYEELARHVYYTETGSTLPQDHEMNPPLVSTQDGMALYLLSGEESSVLTRSLLKDLPTNGEVEDTVVYGDACRVGESMLKERGVTFRQLPYEVRVS